MEERNTPIERPPMLGFKQSKSPPYFYPICLTMCLFQLTCTCSTRRSASRVAMTAVSVRRPGSLSTMSWVGTPRTPARPPAPGGTMRSE